MERLVPDLGEERLHGEALQRARGEPRGVRGLLPEAQRLLHPVHGPRRHELRLLECRHRALGDAGRPSELILHHQLLRLLGANLRGGPAWLRWRRHRQVCGAPQLDGPLPQALGASAGARAGPAAACKLQRRRTGRRCGVAPPRAPARPRRAGRAVRLAGRVERRADANGVPRPAGRPGLLPVPPGAEHVFGSCGRRHRPAAGLGGDPRQLPRKGAAGAGMAEAQGARPRDCLVR
mmetsp:Transcript_62967/g.168171  ORF Transcript_62967/g.168171 Transcript_62967/m.168171 type:complete len:235 (+) Transcript_62967:1017-1721(+)